MGGGGVAILAFASSLLFSAPTLWAQVATNLAPAYRVVDLGFLPGGLDDSYPNALNDAGQVIGLSGVGQTGATSQGFFWDAQNGMRTIQVLAGNYTHPAGINNQGVVVGYSGVGSWFRALQWDSTNGSRWLLPAALAGYPYDGGEAINDSGAIAYHNWSFDGTPSKAYFISGGTSTWIGELYPNSYANPAALNNKNEMVGGMSSCHYCTGQAFFWSSEKGLVSLGFLPGFVSSGAVGINDDSQVVGNCQNSDGTSAAFIWTAEAGMAQLASGGIGGASHYWTRGISAGNIAVGSCQIGGTNVAVAWPPGRDAVNLTSLVPAPGGWVGISTAVGINSSGMIVGIGLRTNGVSHACLLYPVSDVAPSIAGQPANATVAVGGSATFSVAVTGTSPVSYQWQFNGVNLTNGGRFDGVTTSSLAINPVYSSDAGDYRVIVTNPFGSVTSGVATLIVKSGGDWTMTGSMAVPRYGHTTTLLPSGSVLVAGGGNQDQQWLSSAETYDPTTGRWAPAPDMTMRRVWHTATLLRNGKVLVAGGTPGGYWSSSAELYDPVAGTWTAINGMNSARGSHSATLLPSGKVLVVGGAGPGNPVVSTAELYNPATGNWTWTGSMSDARYFHNATLLPDGRVLVAGGVTNPGRSLSSAELYDETIGSWVKTGSTASYQYSTATLLPNGQVLAAGGFNSGGVFDPATEVYDPTPGSWRTTGVLGNIDWLSAATLLSNGQVLATGYAGAYGFNSQVYDPVTEIWTPTGSMNIDRDGHTATLLQDGSVLVVGGWGASAPIATAELYKTQPRFSAAIDIKLFSGIIIKDARLGSHYLIQATPSLTNANWTTLTNVAIPTQPYIYIDYRSYTNGQQFYRALAL